MKVTQPSLSMLGILLLGSLYTLPSFAGATNSGENTSATPGGNSSTVTTPADPALPATPSTPAVPADKAHKNKSYNSDKSQNNKDCNPNVSSNDPTKNCNDINKPKT